MNTYAKRNVFITKQTILQATPQTISEDAVFVNNNMPTFGRFTFPAGAVQVYSIRYGATVPSSSTSVSVSIVYSALASGGVPKSLQVSNCLRNVQYTYAKLQLEPITGLDFQEVVFSTPIVVRQLDVYSESELVYIELVTCTTGTTTTTEEPVTTTQSENCPNMISGETLEVGGAVDIGGGATAELAAGELVIALAEPRYLNAISFRPGVSGLSLSAEVSLNGDVVTVFTVPGDVDEAITTAVTPSVLVDQVHFSLFSISKI